ncbi:TIM barrel protein [Desulfoluna butyratoxydans]|uniref:Xylose isomerase-like tim barrel n=1 Tax=Desulfoluna butyratoxydans TaxID=231438 RepID=A0A4U8YGD9_9BACT|nr:TIM barrel protein [Desulfoluna butyratoxydans]VFQ42406.1 xylose isomerase-like tim barrel [Desulfoluna butyratoxydans]
MHDQKPKFGVAGFPPNFKKHRLKKNRENIFEWLSELGLDWIELQNTYGVKMKKEQAELYRAKAKEFGVGISLHAPYYITLASADPEVVKRSQERVKQMYELAEFIGSKRIIFHPGHFPGDSDLDRSKSLDQLILKLNELKDELPIDKIRVYPEIAGKINQLGSLDEIIRICKEVSFARPCLDLAHLHAREGGSLKTNKDVAKVFERIIEELGHEVLHECHFHMYPVGVDSNGEDGHKSFSDTVRNPQMLLFDSNDDIDVYYPRARPFVEVLKTYGVNPVVICEAKDSQDEGALRMKRIFFEEET